MKELIKKLTETYGPSGREERIREVIKGEIEGLADEMRVDVMGNLIALKRGSSPPAPPKLGGRGRKVMLAAHMDEIGIIVTHVDEKGFLRFARVGGVRPLALVGGRAVFADGTVGTFGLEKREPEEAKKVPGFDKLYLDVGAKDKESAPVGVGDIAGFQRPFAAQGDRLMAKSLDDRVGCAVLIQVMRDLESSPHDVYFVFSVQEEVGLRGAITSTYGIQPDLGISVDVTITGDTPEARTMAVSLGEGPAVKVKDGGMLAHPAVKNLLVETAEELGIPYQLEVLAGGTTDAMAIQVSRAGVPAGCLSIPCRYVHTPTEMVDHNDVLNAVKLFVALLSKPIELG